MIKRLRDFARKDDAVIEVFSEILLTGIIVLAIAAVAAFVLSSLDGPDNVRVDIDHWADKDTDTLYFRHSGGETVDVEDLELLVYVNGSYETLTSEQIRANYDSDEWALGDVIEINTSSQFDITNETISSKLVHTASSMVIYDAYGSIGDSGDAGGGSGDGGGNGGDDGGDGDLATVPALSNHDPNLTYTSTVLETVTFSATSNQSSDNEFLLNGTRVKWSNDTTSPFYVNTTPSVGTYNLTLIARNQTDPSLTDSITWEWTVTDLPICGIAKWPFEYGSGNTAYDYSGTNDGTISGASWVSSEVNGTALDFDGINDYVQVPHDSTLNPQKLTIMLWINTSSAGNNWNSIIDKRESIGNGYDIYLTPTEKRVLWSINSNNVGVESLTSVNDGKWYHIAATYDGNISKIYVDGIEENSVNIGSETISTSSDLYIGRRSISDDYYFDGIIDEVCISSRALSAGEIQNYYESMAPEEPPQADAGIDFTIDEGTTGMLDGSGSSDPDGNIVTYEWAITDNPSGASVSITDADNTDPTATFDASGADVDGDQVVEVTLTVTDDDGVTDSDVVEVTVNDLDVPAIEYVLGTVQADFDGTGSLKFNITNNEDSPVTIQNLSVTTTEADSKWIQNKDGREVLINGSSVDGDMDVNKFDLGEVVQLNQNAQIDASGGVTVELRYFAKSAGVDKRRSQSNEIIEVTFGLTDGRQVTVTIDDI